MAVPSFIDIMKQSLSDFSKKRKSEAGNGASIVCPTNSRRKAAGAAFARQVFFLVYL
jgi:hypothetical protein